MEWIKSWLRRTIIFPDLMLYISQLFKNKVKCKEFLVLYHIIQNCPTPRALHVMDIKCYVKVGNERIFLKYLKNHCGSKRLLIFCYNVYNLSRRGVVLNFKFGPISLYACNRSETAVGWEINFYRKYDLVWFGKVEILPKTFVLHSNTHCRGIFHI